MNKNAFGVNRLNLRNIKVPYAVTGIVILAMLIQDIVLMLIAKNSGVMNEQTSLSLGNLFWLLIPLAAIFIAAKNFRRFIHLGCKRGSYFIGSLYTYIFLAGIISLASTLIFYTYDSFIMGSGYFEGILNCLEVFGWSSNGPLIAFLQQFAFLFLAAAVIHTLTLMQDYWVGWVVDLVLAAIISVFTPIAPLRAVLVWFFNLIIFHSNAFLQISVCLILAAAVYLLSLPVLNRKNI